MDEKRPQTVERLEALASRFWSGELQDRPEMATALGFRQHDHRLSDLSGEGRADRTRRLKALRGELRELDREALSPSDALGAEELDNALGRELARLSAGQHRYLVSSMTGPQTLLFRFPDVQPLRSPEEAEAYLGRLHAAGPYLDAYTRELRGGLEAGLVSAHRAIERVLGQLDRTLAKPTARWSLAEHATGHDPDFGGRAHGALEQVVRPALERLRAFLGDELTPASRSDEHPGLSHIEGGEAAYAAAVEYHTSLRVDPVEVHQQGLDEVLRQVDAVTALGKRELDAPDIASLRVAFGECRQLFYQDRDQVLRLAEDAVARAWERRLEVTRLAPDTPCRVLPVPDAEAPDAPLGYYRAPATDGSVPGTYYVNAHAPESKLAIDAEGVAFHEAVPGHHLQIAVAQTLTLPDFRRFLGPASYKEGWALYSEKLADEMGMYSRDADRLGMLCQDLWRAARLVLDTGLHGLGWSREHAIQWAAANTLLPRAMIENEVDRFVVYPGQALSYKLGEFEVLALREAHAADFPDLVGFHDAVLGLGAVGLPTLRSAVSAAAAEAQSWKRR